MLPGSSFRTDPGRRYSRDDLRALAARADLLRDPIAGQSRATARINTVHVPLAAQDRIRLGGPGMAHPSIPSH
jgi:hypothetical protein